LKLLLDTHTFLWWDDDDRNLSRSAFDAISDPRNEVWFSVVNIWEIVVKSRLGKLTLHKPVEHSVRTQLANRLQLFSLELDHVLNVQSLPSLHNDPFDRMLIAQALAENATLVTKDAAVRQYPVPTLW
jgi:PIN domain nuclease of toxin-antitoxin system